MRIWRPTGRCDCIPPFFRRWSVFPPLQFPPRIPLEFPTRISPATRQHAEHGRRATTLQFGLLDPEPEKIGEPQGSRVRGTRPARHLGRWESGLVNQKILKWPPLFFWRCHGEIQKLSSELLCGPVHQQSRRLFSMDLLRERYQVGSSSKQRAVRRGSEQQQCMLFESHEQWQGPRAKTMVRALRNWGNIARGTCCVDGVMRRWL